MSKRLTVNIALEVASHEALIRQTYLDSEGVPTWCVGMTSATGHNVERYWGKPADHQFCLNLYIWALDRYMDEVQRVFADHPLSETQLAAITSFHWNTGALARASWVKPFKAGNMVEAERRFMLWTKQPALKRRRSLEADLLFRGRWHNNGKMAEYTRLTSKRTPVWRSRTEIDVRTWLDVAMRAHNASIGGQRHVDQPLRTTNDMEDAPGTTLTPREGEGPKSMAKSTTIWAALLQAATTAVGALASLDWRVALPVIIVGAAFAFWIMRERLKKAEEHGI